MHVTHEALDVGILHMRPRSNTYDILCLGHMLVIDDAWTYSCDISDLFTI